jgi:hypothetical protein
MATGDEEDCNLLMQFVVDAERERPLGSPQDEAASIDVTVALESSFNKNQSISKHLKKESLIYNL